MAPPPKARMHAKTGKHKTINTSAGPSPVVATNGAAAPTSAIDADAQRQLELELCWCIQTLEASIDSGKLNAKQAQDTDKTIKILKSANQPVIKKRQVMRASFGDYRARMAAEEQKLRLNAPKIQFTSAANSNDASASIVRSYFVKKSALLTMGKAFKFDFPVANQMTQLDLNETATPAGESAAADDGAKTGDTESVTKPVNTTTSSFGQNDSGFRFNFNVEVEENGFAVQ